MGSRYLLCFFIILTMGIAHAQKIATISEAEAPGLGESKSFTTTITQVDLDFLKISWILFLTRYYGTSMVTKNDGILQVETEHVTLPALNGEVVDIIALMRPLKNDTGNTDVNLTIWIVRKNNTHLSPEKNMETAEKIKNWLLFFDSQLARRNLNQGYQP